MVKSLYVINYFENMKKWYHAQDIIFDNWNDVDTVRQDNGLIPGRDLFHVPRGQAEHLVDQLVRYALSRNVKTPGEPWIYLGWNATAANALEGTRNHITHRVVPSRDNIIVRAPENIPEGSRQTKRYRESTWDLSVFMVTNQGNVAEDLSEIYEAVIQPISEYPVDMGSIFMWDYPEWQINTQHKTLQESHPILNNGNLWTLSYNVTLTGPSIEFNEEQMAACKSISISLYDMSKNQFLSEIRKDK